jgi:hypothetical protein
MAADYTFPDLQTARAGVASTIYLQDSSQIPYSYQVKITNQTLNVGNIDVGFRSLEVDDPRSAMPTKRPQKGLLYPRGVYNK